MGAIRRATGQHYINDNGEPQLPAATTRVSDFVSRFSHHSSLLIRQRRSA